MNTSSLTKDHMLREKWESLFCVFGEGEGGKSQGRLLKRKTGKTPLSSGLESARRREKARRIHEIA